MWARVLLKVYDLLWYLCLPGVLLYLWWRGRRLPAYRQRISERLGFGIPSNPVDVWMHAVSVGEVVAATSMVQACLDKGYKVLLTTMTPTGSAQVKRLWGDKVLHQYCPYDVSFAIRRFLKAYQPRILVIFETELWPGILSQCSYFRIPAILVNARISNRSWGSYLKTKMIWQTVFGFLQAIYVQSELDKQRFLALGVRPNTLHWAGNLKFQQHFIAQRLDAWRTFKQQYPGQKMVVFGSTHAGEEAAILQEWPKFLAKHPDAIAIFVPRHPERFAEVWDLIKAFGGAVKYSEWSPEVPVLHYLLLDAMGELSSLYAIADVAFVGGSLVPIGGHNVLEPMAFGVPVITGPFMHNQQDLVRILSQAQAINVLPDVRSLASSLEQLCEDPSAMVEQAEKTLAENQGATAICMQGVEGLMNQAP